MVPPMQRDETLRRTIQFFATFVQENQVPPRQVSELLKRADAELLRLEQSEETLARVAASMRNERDTMLSANEILLAENLRMKRGLEEIVRNGVNEPAAGDYAKDIIEGKEVTHE